MEREERTLKEQLKDEANLRRLAVVVRDSNDAITVQDFSGRILAWNLGAERMYGYTEKEALGMSALDLVPEECREDYRRMLASLERGDPLTTFETRRMTRDGRVMDVWLSVWVTATPLPDEEGQVRTFSTTERDITERKRAEGALREMETKYRTLAENSPDLIARYDKDLRHVYVNTAAARAGRLSPSEYFGKTLAESGVPEPAAGQWGQRIRRALETGKLIDEEDAFPTPDGLRYFHIRLTPELAPDGSVSSVLSVARDISERRSLKEQFLQAQKMDAVGRLAGGVAHDFNNILMAIMSYSELLLLKLEEGPLREYALGIQQSVEKAASLTQQLLAFSRKEVSNPFVLEFNEVVADAEKMLRRMIGEDIELVIHLAPDAGRVKADPGQLGQVIVNLAVNARDAMPEGGKLLIQTANAVLDESEARLHPGGAPGRYVQLSVSDTGHGMDEATQARIFEPFFTTKEQGKGTGLGLSTVYGIIQQSGGFTEVESAPGKGARFKVYLPRVEEEAGANPKPPVNPELPRGAETVLLVEDEPEILGVINEILVGQGYTVLQAGTGDAALRLAERHPGPIHLLLTDVVMPGMSGRVLAERLASLRPDIRVLFTSGYTDDAILRHGLRTEGLNFLQKPYRPDALTNKVREVLDAP